MEAPDTLETLRYTNASAIKRHALACSKTHRSGTFDRVSQDFIDRVQNTLDNAVRELNARFQPPVHDVLPPDPGTQFVTGLFMEKVEKVLNDFAARCIQDYVRQHPSVGKTLKR